MSRALALFLIGLIFGTGIGFTIAAGNGVTLDGHDHTDLTHHQAEEGSTDHMTTHATMFEVPAAAAPKLHIEITPDPVAGDNLHVITENFTFSPLAAGSAHVPGQGHAHVYVNGVKHGRVYGPWMHLDGLPKGRVEVSVTLNTNDHRPLSAGGSPVAAIQTITVE